LLLFVVYFLILIAIQSPQVTGVFCTFAFLGFLILLFRWLAVRK
jgi:hypothetical protein